jgi:hypothetical protein
MRTLVAGRTPAWRCPACGLTCDCLAAHWSCTARPFLAQYGHHMPLPSPASLDIDQLQQDGAQAPAPILARFHGE